MDLQTIKSILKALDKEQVRYVLVGGVAINFHGLARATRDIDLFVETSEDNIARLKRALYSVFRDPAIEDIHASDLAGEYPTIRYGPPKGDMLIDLLGRLGEAFCFEDLKAQEIIIDGIRVQLATPTTLYRMKKDTIRLQDRHDAQALKYRFDIKD